MTVSTPRFITIEGGEGAGKSTLIERLARRLEASEQRVLITREPGGTPLAEDLRGLLLNKSDVHGDISAMTEALILSAARRDHVDQKISPMLNSGGWVLCDRFTDSTRAYQGSSLTDDQLEMLESCATNGLAPGLTFLLDAEPEKLLERRIQRGGDADRFERRSMAFHNNVRDAFLQIAERFSDRVVVIDALDTADTVFQSAWSTIVDRFALNEAKFSEEEKWQ